MSDVDYLYYRKRQQEKKIEESENRIANYKNKIERLESYKKKVSTYKTVPNCKNSILFILSSY